MSEFASNSEKFAARAFNKQRLQTDNVFGASLDESSELRLQQAIENDNIDAKYGFHRVKDHQERTGFLLNMHATEILNEDKRLVAAIDYYFMQEDGTRFKVSYPFSPYFYVLTRRELLSEVMQFLTKKFSGSISNVEIVTKDDLDMPNHLIGLKQRYLKLSFSSQNDLIKVRKAILPMVKKNIEREKTNTFYNEMMANALSSNIGDVQRAKTNVDHMENIIDIREYDVPYHVRVSIDLKIFCGSWYTVKCKGAHTEPPTIHPRPDLIERPEPIVLAFDIETTKLPLKFPDAATDQIMMISYMIDGQGYLITNREILSADIDDFEYTPKPEFEGQFTIFNEPNEMCLLQKFFDHILEVRPHVFVTYNGDFFDWPFVETRAAAHELDMKQEIGFYKNKDGVYCCRPAMHMDCLCWVKRDSYLPVGSQNLKAVAKAKLRYDPVELDPEEMCPLAASQPQVLSNYSVSDAVATYYLYMQYVHPFIFALCTIIPCEPDEVLRKGSGTLCEALLMVQAFHANIIFPNKEETILNKLTDDGHVLLQDTYVGGHVEALESGVFRADIPCRFRLAADAIQELIEKVPKALRHAVEVEEGVPLEEVTNFDEVVSEVVEKLNALKAQPLRLERPLIYHLDVGAMYPNIILTNRLQPCAMVDETVCAACDFNKPDATCQRKMAWMWRAEYMPATRYEYQQIQQQLEIEKFPPKFRGGPQRAFHQLTKQEQAEWEKKRLALYCRKVYKKNKITKVQERYSTICQKENSFYVDTVRAFRDRRYEYKGLSKKAKQQVVAAVKGGDAGEIKSAKNREVLYDSLQLAHKCILNSFYGYVMRRGARWHSMEMGGIVCYTGANIIMKAREIIEQVGRPLELDTDGIWCILPASFPENVTIHTTHEKKRKLIISYPNAVLNSMVKEHFTNDQYHELVDRERLIYEQRSENSIFFEVDGPYKAMVLPASKEEGKKLKKRYAVFNFDGSLAELKGFEVKRRGELQLIKNFQSSVFEAFLKGDTLETCYAAVAQVADFWLDVLYSKGAHMPDSELFDLIAENRSMSKKLEDYGEQKSTSISTAKRLAEFLGDQMVKDAGLACKYVISRKPDGAPVTERAIPLAIFQSDEATQRKYLRKWLKDNSLITIEIRDILDWNYYIERLGGAIQKIITIPAAMQGVANPVPRIRHPDWLHKKMLEKNDNFKQRRITEMFSVCAKEDLPSTSRETGDIEDFGRRKSPNSHRPIANVSKRKRSEEEFSEEDLNKTWREVLGKPPSYGSTKEKHMEWLAFQKKKWRFQALERVVRQRMFKKPKNSTTARSVPSGGLGGFLQKAQKLLLTSPWHILQILPTSTPGEFKLWALVRNDLHSELHCLKLLVPRIYYANLKEQKCADEGAYFKKCNRILPRSRPVHNLYQFSVAEEIYIENKGVIDPFDPLVEGVYERQVPLMFRALLKLGCACKVLTSSGNLDTFSLDDLEMVAIRNYLPPDTMKHLYLYHHKALTGSRQMYALFLTPIKKALIVVVDSVRMNLMPNMQNLYEAERIVVKQEKPNATIPPQGITFEVRVETDMNQVYKLLQKTLQAYRDEKKGPTFLALQTMEDVKVLQAKVSILNDFPHVQIHFHDVEDLYSTLEWQKVGAKTLIRNYIYSEKTLELLTEQCHYYHLPVGNVPVDCALFAADLFYARNLVKQNHMMWCSPLDRPDLGGVEENDARLLAESQESSSEVCNNSGWYSSVCVELDIDSLAINTLLQSHHIAEMEGTTSATAFNAAAITSLDSMMDPNSAATLSVYDESARCAEAFRILKTMASGWMRDISVHRNVFADHQVMHFYRWLRTPKALLYDPALVRTLQNLMRKLFIQLVAEFKRLGCAVVYANFDKIVLCTKRQKIDDAAANVEFILASIRNKELFHSLEITPSRYWEQLVWMDPTNYAGIKEKSPEETNIQEEDDEDKENDDETPDIDMHWSIAEQLTETAGCRYSFIAVIVGYVTAIHKKMKEMEGRESAVLLLSQPSLGLGGHEHVVNYAKEIISEDISLKLFNITERINTRLPPKEDTGESAALDFVKAICHVLSLDAAVEETVYHLKGNLLKLLGVGEFSERAVFKDKSVSYVIPQIICRVCNHCRDLDLGRDFHKTESAWLCSLCNSPYDTAEIESFLLDTITRKLLAFNLQDLQCKKCTQIKLENMIQRCPCAGEFRHLNSREDIIKLLGALKELSAQFNMPCLLETVNNTLQLI